MSTESIVLQGEVLADGSIKVHKPVNLPPGPVELTVRPVASPQGEGIIEFLTRLHADQQARGHVPRSAEEVDASIRQMRDEWEERQTEIERIQEEGRRSRERRGTSPEGGE